MDDKTQSQLMEEAQILRHRLGQIEEALALGKRHVGRSGEEISRPAPGSALVGSNCSADVADTTTSKAMIEQPEILHHLLLQHMLDGFAFHQIVLDSDGHPVDYIFLEVNESFIDITGVKREAIIGKRATEVFPGIEKGGFDWIGTYGKVALSGEPVTFEQYFEDLARRFRISAYTPRLGYFAVAFDDITERNRSESVLREAAQSLRASETRYRELVETLPVGVFELDVDGNITFANPTALQQFGFSQEDVERCPPVALIVDPQDHDRLTKRFEERLSGWPGEPSEYTARRKNGSKFPVLISSTRITKQDRVVGVRGFILDISRLKATEEALRDSELRYRTMMESIDDGIAVKDVEGRFVLVNREMELRLDLPEREIIGKTAPDVKWEFGTQASWEGDLHVLRTGKPMETVIEYPGRKRAPICHVRKVPLRDECGRITGLVSVSRDIQEVMAVQHALRESEERFRVIFDRAGIGIAVTGIDGRIVQSNAALQRMLGYLPEELNGMMVRRITHPEDLAKEAILAEKLIAGETDRYELEKRYIRKDGTSLWGQLVVTIVRGGRPIVIGMVEDITKRKMAEQEVLFQASLLDQVRNAVIAVDLDGKVTYWNRYAEALYQWKAEEVLGRPILEVNVPFEALAKADQVMREVIERGRWEGEFPVLRKDGSTFLARVHNSAIKDGSGRLCGFIGVSYDITEEKKSEQALRESEERFRRITDNMLDMVSQTDAEGVYQYVSPSHLQVLGCLPEQLAGRSVLDLVHPDDQFRIASAIAAGVSSRSGGREAFRYLHADGHYLWLEAVGSILTDEEGKVVGAVYAARDITEQKLAEEEVLISRERLRRLTASLVEVQESERRHIARELHDEIGQTLTGLKVSLDMIKQRGDLSAAHLDDARQIVRDLMRQVRSISLSLHSGLLDDLGLIPAVAWLLDRVAGQTGLEVSLKHSGIDGRRLPYDIEMAAYRVVQEGLTNVTRHSGAKVAEVRVWNAGGLLIVQIEDQGVGFDAERYSTGDSLGLIGMRERVELLGGRFTVDSQPGVGTRLTAEFPIDGECPDKKDRRSGIWSQ